MKKTIISLSIVAGLVLCMGLHSSNKSFEVKNSAKSNISINLFFKNYDMENIICEEDPGTRPPESKGLDIV